MNAWCFAVNRGELTLADLKDWDLALEGCELFLQYELSPGGYWELNLMIRPGSGVVSAEYGPEYSTYW